MDWLLQLDENILLWIQENARKEWLNLIVNAITSLGNAGWFWLVLLIALLFFAKYRKTGITGLISVAIGFLVTNLWLKNMVNRIRPYEVIEGLEFIGKMPSDASFPSGHATCSMAASVVLFLKLPKRYGIPILLLGIVISLSRLYLGVHYPTDVLAGMVIGMLAAGIAIKIMNHWKS